MTKEAPKVVRKSETKADRDVSPFYQDKYVSLYVGNSATILPAVLRSEQALRGKAKFDHIITDPPGSQYVDGVSLAAFKSGGKSSIVSYSCPPLSPSLLRACAKAWWPVVKDSVLIFTDDQLDHVWRRAMVRRGFSSQGRMFWVQPADASAVPNQKPTGQSQWYQEIELFSTKPRPALRRGHAIYRFGSENEVDHRHFKPVSLMQRIVADFTKVGDLVLDPFAGLGSTLLACKNMGRIGVGIERDARLAELTVKRLSQQLLDLEFLGEDDVLWAKNAVPLSEPVSASDCELFGTQLQDDEDD